MLFVDRARRLPLTLAVAFAVLVAAASPAWAQTRAVEVSGAYAYLSDQEFNMPVGWLADAAFKVSETTRVVAEVGRHSRALGTFGVPFNVSVATYQGGLRVTGHAGRVAVFGQALGGLGRFGGRVSTGQIDLSLTMNAISLQFGGGVIVPAGGRLGVRAGVDYRYAAMLSTDLPVEARQWRVATGFALALGRHMD